MPDGVPFDRLSRDRASIVDNEGTVMNVDDTTGALETIDIVSFRANWYDHTNL